MEGKIPLRLVDMCHAGSPNSVKEHIINEMGRKGSHLRIIICTVAFGMGINCKDTHRSIHFGPPKTVEFLVQESGRIGRDGKQSISNVLYNGLLSSQCNGYMKQLMQTKACRREHISNLFCVSENEPSEKNCLCCDNCALHRQCTKMLEKMEFGKNVEEACTGSIPIKTRSVTDAQRQELHQKLLAYRQKLLPDSVTEFMPVGPPNVFFEFSQFQIEQVLNNCHHLFTVAGILEHIEIWRQVQAQNVCLALQEIFGDMDDDMDSMLLEDEFQECEIVDEDWELVTDDSNLMIDLQDIMLSNLETSVENSLAQSITSEQNSGIFATLASAAEIKTAE